MGIFTARMTMCVKGAKGRGVNTTGVPHAVQRVGSPKTVGLASSKAGQRCVTKQDALTWNVSVSTLLINYVDSGAIAS